ncbi:MAG: tyrosine recombinase XerC [Clostridiaceae bacterium]|nr:tyrosine recombinase XerC [Clostridiaceae bacterium]
MSSFEGAPQVLSDFLSYIDTVKGKSLNTSKEYFYDIRTFLRFLKVHKKLVPDNTDFNCINIDDVTIQMLSDVTLSDLYEYLAYTNRIRGNTAASRARKVSSLKTFYKYLTTKKNYFSNNPAKDLETPKIGKTLPKYLDLNSSKALLSAADGVNKRDYCMLTLLLNCGLRLSELIGINISDIKTTTLTVTGKGNKQRTVYLNEACIKAIKIYLEVRPKDKVKDRDALFLNKNNQRIGARGVQLMVKKYLNLAGLDTKKYSTHKLRHTAATLLYRHGNVDIRVLQEILGHENLSTTQIYTHTESSQLQDAINKNPLSGISSKEKRG